jgi:hypothetical protein
MDLGSLVLCTGAWSEGKRLQPENTRQKNGAKGLYVAVQDGQLSVDLQEADMGEVLEQIGRQAGIRISSGPSSGKKVTARFADVELEEGIRLQVVIFHNLIFYNARMCSRCTKYISAKSPVSTGTPP